MKPVLLIITVCLIIFTCSVCSSSYVQQHTTIKKIMGDGILQSLDDEKNSRYEHFSIPIGSTNNKLTFSENGKVYVQIQNSNQTFDISGLQQVHRLNDLKIFLQQSR
jgi:hypothetical protein